jgi:hypothetical protein
MIAEADIVAMLERLAGSLPTWQLGMVVGWCGGNTLTRGSAMLDHASLGVSDIDRSRRFYDAALRPLGIVRIADFGAGRGSDYGAAPSPLGVE